MRPILSGAYTVSCIDYPILDLGGIAKSIFYAVTDCETVEQRKSYEHRAD